MRWACDVLRPVYDATNGVDGRVSIEVDARLAHDTEATIAEARALWWLVDRPNLFIKIPAARQGLPAIAGCLAEGISINVTLIFSLQRYDAVMEAFLDGMERARQAGHDLSPIGSVASFFVSRVDTDIDARLDKIGTSEAAGLRGRAPEALPENDLLVVQVPQGTERAVQGVPHPRAGLSLARALAGCHHDHLDVLMACVSGHVLFIARRRGAAVRRRWRLGVDGTTPRVPGRCGSESGSIWPSRGGRGTDGGLTC